MKRPFVLLTNDDGIHAPGIRHLWEAVSEYADTAIVAPLTEKSGCGVSITWAKPLRIQKVLWEDQKTPAWSLTGTPADCVKMALGVLLDQQPDLILSGINRGSNAGRTVLYSGTIGGIIDGCFKNVPGIAFSFCDLTPPPLEVTKPYIVSLIQHVLEHPLPLGTFLNVTFPLNSKERINGMKMAIQGKGYWKEKPEQRVHPEGVPYYWLGGAWSGFEEEEDSDIAWLEKGYATVVPIQISQLTDYEIFRQKKETFETLFPAFNVSLKNPPETNTQPV